MKQNYRGGVAGSIADAAGAPGVPAVLADSLAHLPNPSSQPNHINILFYSAYFPMMYPHFCPKLLAAHAR
jgi:hypothetical protein